MKYLTYHPEPAYRLPPSAREVRGEDPVCFFLHRAVERLDWSALEQRYVEEGRPAYHPALLRKVWLYAYVLGITAARRLEQRIREDLAFRYPAGGATPDFLDSESVPDAAHTGAERSVHAGRGTGALGGAGTCGD